MKKVGIIMGSDSDLPVVEKAIGKLKEYGVIDREAPDASSDSGAV